MVKLESGLMVMLLFTIPGVQVDPLVVITIGNVVGVVFVEVGFPVISKNNPPLIVSTTVIVSPSFPSTSFNETAISKLKPVEDTVRVVPPVTTAEIPDALRAVSISFSKTNKTSPLSDTLASTPVIALLEVSPTTAV